MATVTRYNRNRYDPSRFIRARYLAPKVLKEGDFYWVPSEENPRLAYKVEQYRLSGYPDQWICSCPDFSQVETKQAIGFKHSRQFTSTLTGADECKHILAVKLARGDKIDNTPGNISVVYPPPPRRKISPCCKGETLTEKTRATERVKRVTQPYFCFDREAYEGWKGSSIRVRVRLEGTPLIPSNLPSPRYRPSCCSATDYDRALKEVAIRQVARAWVMFRHGTTDSNDFDDSPRYIVFPVGTNEVEFFISTQLNEDLTETAWMYIVPIEGGTANTSCAVATLTIYGEDAPGGCTDQLANNFDPDAFFDDGSCEYNDDVNGCTDPNAVNYDPDAVVDDDSCEYDEPPGDDEWDDEWDDEPPGDDEPPDDPPWPDEPPDSPPGYDDPPDNPPGDDGGFSPPPPPPPPNPPGEIIECNIYLPSCSQETIFAGCQGGSFIECNKTGAMTQSNSGGDCPKYECVTECHPVPEKDGFCNDCPLDLPKRYPSGWTESMPTTGDKHIRLLSAFHCPSDGKDWYLYGYKGPCSNYVMEETMGDKTPWKCCPFDEEEPPLPDCAVEPPPGSYFAYWSVTTTCCWESGCRTSTTTHNFCTIVIPFSYAYPTTSLGWWYYMCGWGWFTGGGCSCSIPYSDYPTGSVSIVKVRDCDYTCPWL